MSWRRGEPLGELAAVRFGSAGDVGAVALDDERELHDVGVDDGRLRLLAGAARARFDRQFLHAREQHLVDAALPLEVVAAVLEQPAEHRHQQAPLDEDGSATRRLPAMRLVAHRRLEPPGGRIAEQLRQQQRGRAGFGRRASSARPRRRAPGLRRRRGAVAQRAAAAGARAPAPAAPSSPRRRTTLTGHQFVAHAARGPGRWRWREATTPVFCFRRNETLEARLPKRCSALKRRRISLLPAS